MSDEKIIPENPAPYDLDIDRSVHKIETPKMRPPDNYTSLHDIHEKAPVRGSLAEVQAERKRLDKLEKEIEARDKKKKKDDAEFQKRIEQGYEKGIRELFDEVNKKISACPGERTNIPCPICINGPVISSTRYIKHPGGGDFPINPSIGKPVFLLRMAKKNIHRCPNCGYEGHVF